MNINPVVLHDSKDFEKMRKSGKLASQVLDLLLLMSKKMLLLLN